MISGDVKSDVKQEIKKIWYLDFITFHRNTFSKLVVGIPCRLTWSIKNVEDEGGGGKA